MADPHQPPPPPPQGLPGVSFEARLKSSEALSRYWTELARPLVGAQGYSGKDSEIGALGKLMYLEPTIKPMMAENPEVIRMALQRTAAQILTGDAAKRATEYLAATGPVTFAGLRAHLVSKFLTEAVREEYRWKFLSFKELKGETPLEALERFQAIREVCAGLFWLDEETFKPARSFQESEARRQFLIGLGPDDARANATVKDLETIAHNADLGRSLEKSARARQEKPAVRAADVPQPAGDARAPSKGRDRREKPDRELPPYLGECHHCGGTGHVKRMCPFRELTKAVAVAEAKKSAEHVAQLKKDNESSSYPCPGRPPASLQAHRRGAVLRRKPKGRKRKAAREVPSQILCNTSPAMDPLRPAAHSAQVEEPSRERIFAEVDLGGKTCGGWLTPVRTGPS